MQYLRDPYQGEELFQVTEPPSPFLNAYTSTIYIVYFLRCPKVTFEGFQPR